MAMLVPRPQCCHKCVQGRVGAQRSTIPEPKVVLSFKEAKTLARRRSKEFAKKSSRSQRSPERRGPCSEVRCPHLICMTALSGSMSWSLFHEWGRLGKVLAKSREVGKGGEEVSPVRTREKRSRSFTQGPCSALPGPD